MDILTFLKKQKIDYLLDENLSNHTNFKIGGKCKILAKPQDIKSTVKLVKFLSKQNINFFILGNGTNILASDNGFNGVVIKLGNQLKNYKIKKTKACFECGFNVFEMNRLLCKNNLSGLEFTYGIPGSVGGLICMNGGAFEHSVCEKVFKVKVFDGKKVKTLKVKDMYFSHRNSIFLEKNYIILSATFLLEKRSSEDIKNKMDNYFEKRKSTQPYTLPSAGSVFKRLENGKKPVSKMIDELGLKGKSVGDAQISTIHAGFIVNNGKATCQDVLKLIKYIKEQVQLTFGYNLQLEIRYLGDFNDITWWLSYTYSF